MEWQPHFKQEKALKHGLVFFSKDNMLFLYFWYKTWCFALTSSYMMKMKRSYLLSILSKEIIGLVSIVYEQLQLGLLQRWKGHRKSDKCSLKSITARKILREVDIFRPAFSSHFFCSAQQFRLAVLTSKYCSTERIWKFLQNLILVCDKNFPSCLTEFWNSGVPQNLYTILYIILT